MRKIDPGNQEALAALVKLIQTSESEFTHWRTAESLRKIDPGNQEALAALVKLIQTSQNKNTRNIAAHSLKKILEKAQMAKVVSALSNYLSIWTFITNRERYRDCYDLLWHCAQTLPYPDFYKALPQQQKIKLLKLLRVYH